MERLQARAGLLALLLITVPAGAAPTAGSKAAAKPAAKAATQRSSGQGSRAVSTSKQPPRFAKPTKATGKGTPGKAAASEPVTTGPDMAMRRHIAGGPTEEDLRAGKNDPELSALREAEVALFPKPLPGVVPGWSWDVPRALDQGGPEIVAGAPPATRLVPSAEPQAVPNTPFLKSLTLPDIPVRFEERVLRYLSFYRESPSGRAIARAWAKKVGRYAPMVKAELARAGLPTDLVWVSLIESSHNPVIVSPAGAAGLWQFMPDAGRTYGLTINRWIDERLDPVRSTEAACRYLSDLYRRFGTWELAMAAYNMGYAGLARAIRKYNTNEYWQLVRYEAGIPWETTLYVPKILATALVMNNKRAFGLDDVEPDPPERFDTVLVGPGVRLETIARYAGVPRKEIEDLNPQFLAGRTPPAAPGSPAMSYRVRVPAGKAASVREGLARGGTDDESLERYVVKRGETVESIALAHGTTEAQLRLINAVSAKEVLNPGTVLLVPQSERTREDAPDADVVVVPPRPVLDRARRRVFYRVQAGDSLERIAQAFSVSRADLLTWNALDGRARLQPGMTLQVLVSKNAKLSHVRHLPEEKARVLVAGSPEFFEYFEGQNGKKRMVLRARPGDSLAAIGKRYGMSVGYMERVNRRSRNDALTPGEPVVVYTERAQPLAGDSLFREPTARATPERVARSSSGASGTVESAAVAEQPTLAGD
ncbi:MAG: LysM peptidoglycan-binding domain-containing protein [Pseudomonadota bacterium]